MTDKLRTETIVFNREGTGGNCTALIHRFAGRSNEILLTDGDLSAPKNIHSFPYEAALFIDGDYEFHADIKNIEDLFSFVEKCLSREIDGIKGITEEYVSKK